MEVCPGESGVVFGFLLGENNDSSNNASSNKGENDFLLFSALNGPRSCSLSAVGVSRYLR